ncbi:hypothetical protein L1987_32839 [Smallanthus sonchifolius]|uniref:Uncharacterized protein n=1 Tax=Smallanthus sonchifolius TaxID=185202 RepID=A0ACB9HPE5_9ASTR|nr:hypothetical protein L1987_32839 [Smallanthus sonchifolius]
MSNPKDVPNQNFGEGTIGTLEQQHQVEEYKLELPISTKESPNVATKEVPTDGSSVVPEVVDASSTSEEASIEMLSVETSPNMPTEHDERVASQNNLQNFDPQPFLTFFSSNTYSHYQHLRKNVHLQEALKKNN